MEISRLGPEDYLNERVDDQIRWLSEKASSSKANYRATRFLQTALGIFITAGGAYANRMDLGPQIITTLGVLVSLAAAWESVNDYQNNWIRYRRALEDLKREKLLYQTTSGPYRLDGSEMNVQEKSFTLFVSRVEALLAQEEDAWSVAATRAATANSKGASV
ncbi:MAG: DUF4231 domain-containing protein [Cyanobacteriota bacterium]|nr:DUF4231 domain-containing protein [Cyanobacteriota bacterium]